MKKSYKSSLSVLNESRRHYKNLIKEVKSDTYCYYCLGTSIETGTNTNWNGDPLSTSIGPGPFSSLAYDMYVPGQGSTYDLGDGQCVTLAYGWNIGMGMLSPSAPMADQGPGPLLGGSYDNCPYATGDAGCPDSNADNFNGGEADCNGTPGGMDTSCCEYPFIPCPCPDGTNDESCCYNATQMCYGCGLGDGVIEQEIALYDIVQGQMTGNWVEQSCEDLAYMDDVNYYSSEEEAEGQCGVPPMMACYRCNNGNPVGAQFPENQGCQHPWVENWEDACNPDVVGTKPLVPQGNVLALDKKEKYKNKEKQKGEPMKTNYKSNMDKLNESRNYFKSLLKEQAEVSCDDLAVANPELYNGCPGKCENENLPANDPCTPYCHCYTPEEVSQGYTEAPETPGEGMPPQGGVGKPNISKLPQKGVLPKGKGMKNSKNLGRVNTFRRKANLGRK